MAQAIQIGLGRLANTSNVSGLNTFSKTINDTQRNLLKREEAADEAYDDLNKVNEDAVVRDVLDNTISDTYRLVKEKYEAGMQTINDEFEKKLGTTTELTRGIDGKYKETPEYAKLKETRNLMEQNLHDAVADELDAGRLDIIRNPENYASHVFRNLIDKGVDPVKAEEIRKQTLEQHKEPDITKRRLFQLEQQAKQIDATQDAENKFHMKSGGSQTTMTHTGQAGKGATGYKTTSNNMDLLEKLDKVGGFTDSEKNRGWTEWFDGMMADTRSDVSAKLNTIRMAAPSATDAEIREAAQGALEGNAERPSLNEEIWNNNLAAVMERNLKNGTAGGSKQSTTTQRTTPITNPNALKNMQETNRTANKNRMNLIEQAGGRPSAEEYVQTLFGKVKKARDILEIPKKVRTDIKQDKTVPKKTRDIIKKVEDKKPVTTKEFEAVKKEHNDRLQLKIDQRKATKKAKADGREKANSEIERINKKIKDTDTSRKNSQWRSARKLVEELKRERESFERYLKRN